MNEEYKCKDCKWLTGKKTIRGIECMNPKLQEKWNGAKNLWMGELRKDNARYKQASGLACKKFEAKEQTMIDIGADLQRAFDEGYEKGKADRPQGEWVRAMDGNDMHVKCTSCFKTYDWDTQAQYYNFCPNCGARMKGADDETD